jgi:hypothetical protein
LQFDPKSGQAAKQGAGPALWAPHTFLADYSARPTRDVDDNFRALWAYIDKKQTPVLSSFIGHAQFNPRAKCVRGNLLVHQGPAVYGFRQDPAAGKVPGVCTVFRRTAPDTKVWENPLPGPVTLNSALLAGDMLVLGGVIREKDQPARGHLWFFTAADGQKRGEMDLPLIPRWDSLAAADGRLLISTTTGSILCMGTDGK